MCQYLYRTVDEIKERTFYALDITKYIKQFVLCTPLMLFDQIKLGMIFGDKWDNNKPYDSNRYKLVID